jgi:hypothetical protein
MLKINSMIGMKVAYFIIFLVLLSVSAHAEGLEWASGTAYFIVGNIPCSGQSNSAFCIAANCCWCSSGGTSACQICPCPSIIPPSSGGGSAPPLTNPDKSTSNMSSLPFSMSSNLIEVRLYPGEYQIVPLGIVNNQGTNRTFELSVDGDIWTYTLFEKDKYNIGPGSSEDANIKFYTLPTTRPGVYNGFITVKTGNETKRIAVVLRVEYANEKLLDIKVDSITKEVYPGDRFKYLVTVYNLGLTKRVDIYLNYTIRSVENDTIVAMIGETVAIETSLSFDRNIMLPNSTREGMYVIEAIASYEDKRATSVATFEVVKPFWLIPLLKGLFSNWLTYIVMFILIPGIYLLKKLYEKIRMKKIYRARYVRPVDLAKLPKRGLYVGKVAETNANAYINPEDLTTHMIIAGGTGSGKSVSSMVVAEELLKRNIPVIVFDPTAQWTGFIRPNTDSRMQNLYAKFGLKKEDARAFKGTILQVKDPFMKIEVDKFIKPGEITILLLNKLTPEQLDYFVRKTIDYMFSISWPESRDLKVMLIYDEIHRLLPRYVKRKVSSLEGGGYLALERAVREFRKWGIGLMMISQVLLDFKGAIRAVIATETQMRTKYEGDINRVKTRYGWQYSSSIPKLEVGTGLIQNPGYNNGKPWFITFRPLLHDTFRISDQELETYDSYNRDIMDLRKQIEDLKAKKIDTYDMELEVNLAEEKTKTGQLRMAETYIESVKSRLDSINKRKK